MWCASQTKPQPATRSQAGSHQTSRIAQDILDVALNPWPTIFFPEQSDYGIDGDVKLTEEGFLEVNKKGKPERRVFDLTIKRAANC